jgi:amidase/aspartyl-tRNA(Asn)/glutamyl-tRNA(Gln) amidotransferase subunit A
MSEPVATAGAIAAAVHAGRRSAADEVETALARIAATDSSLNAFTEVLAERARTRAVSLDRMPAAERARLPLAGVPFAVKNLFDIEGLRTLAGSRIERDRAPAARDAILIRRLEAAGAVLVGALNMDEYAYGFTTENSHAGPTRNPHDFTRIAGGSSGGSGAAVAAGQVPLTLGSDTNGSIRVPASLCGVFGLRPTYGRLPRTGSYPFVASIDALGPFARSSADLALAYSVMLGRDAGDPASLMSPQGGSAFESDRAAGMPSLDGLRIATLAGYFEDNAGEQAREAVAAVAGALGVTTHAMLAGAEHARAAAFLITNAEGGALHLDDLRARADDFDPLIRDRMLAGALLPAAWIDRARRVRQRVAFEAARLFEQFDVLLAAATPVPATPIGAATFTINGRTLAARPNMGLLTQPISCVGLPVCAVPVWSARPAWRLPVGVQIITAPWREDLALAVAAELERVGVVRAPVAAL